MKTLKVISIVLVCFATGYIASQLQDDSLKEWYPYLNKPALTPPNNVFPIVWSIIYLLMGISGGLILISKNIRKNNVLGIFALQLTLNFIWSILFFTFRSPIAGFVNIFLLGVFVIYYIFKSYTINKTASLLFVPYILWLFLATYLNSYILLCN